MDAGSSCLLSGTSNFFKHIVTLGPMSVYEKCETLENYICLQNAAFVEPRSAEVSVSMLDNPPQHILPHL
jgi:hypothetical protein